MYGHFFLIYIYSNWVNTRLHLNSSISFYWPSIVHFRTVFTSRFQTCTFVSLFINLCLSVVKCPAEKNQLSASKNYAVSLAYWLLCQYCKYVSRFFFTIAFHYLIWYILSDKIVTGIFLGLYANGFIVSALEKR